MLFTLLILSATAGLAADSNDWVNINYVLKHIGDRSSIGTSSAQSSIASNAGSTARQGPWSVTRSPVVPPSGDKHDYLSWAPYHWPDCNWCSKGTNHFANPNSTEDTGDGSDPDATYPDDDDYEGGGVTTPNSERGYLKELKGPLLYPKKRSLLDAHRRMQRVRRHESQTAGDKTHPLVLREVDTAPFPQPSGTSIKGVSVPTRPPTLSAVGDSRSQKRAGEAPAPAQAPAKAQQTASKCTPSPTKSLAPSATWTTCPYVIRDGKVNPDVRTITDSSDIMNMAQSVLYNGIAYVLQKSPANSKNAVSFIDTFFLAASTAMNPNMNYGQLVRGPGKEHQVGTFTGILDLRALVKVVNAIQLLRVTNSPDWTAAREQAMSSWMKTYVAWLQGSKIGRETASKANNHLSFYVSQLAAAQMLVGDNNGATSTLQNYFQHQFLDQIAVSGEQPFEAVRTRPYHYRCFNLEAMITNAKLGDQLGQNFWAAKSKYDATIQTALDFVMAQDPKGEDVSDIFPHVAAVAAAYGDPKGKYQNFLQSKFSDYKSAPFYFYDQTEALPNSPAAAGKQKRDDLADAPDGTIDFVCPAVFQLHHTVALEYGLDVTCKDLEPFYELPKVPSTFVQLQSLPAALL